MTRTIVARVAALYDVHGNLPALDAVPPRARRPRAIHPRERRPGADRAAEPEREAGPQAEILDSVRAWLSTEQLDFLGGLPLTESIEVEGLGEVLFCHATPRSDDA